MQISKRVKSRITNSGEAFAESQLLAKVHKYLNSIREHPELNDENVTYFMGRLCVKTQLSHEDAWKTDNVAKLSGWAESEEVPEGAVYLYIPRPWKFSLGFWGTLLILIACILEFFWYFFHIEIILNISNITLWLNGFFVNGF